ncbi:YbaN family protein [Paralimibaculum aggregatum]|uniref:YbaN family protein n=1 Tax=Paralimibaculum aggregatum TaxID=3036245 RepID=A0ABQ6LNG8_9RHOB|nr:YbaN family protein [Limibaculum sp. NKW23]GMG82753.1 YbaN family protein [Limibaculum sp. NKW23]
MTRMLWMAAGWTAFGAGLVGAVLPLLPTVPFMLLAAFCFARGSERIHAWLTTHPRFGPAIDDWRVHGAISRRGKRWALGSMAASFGISLALGVAAPVLAVQAAVLGVVAVFILTRPDRPAPGG